MIQSVDMESLDAETILYAKAQMDRWRSWSKARKLARKEGRPLPERLTPISGPSGCKSGTGEASTRIEVKCGHCGHPILRTIRSVNQMKSYGQTPGCGPDENGSCYYKRRKAYRKGKGK